ncbi:MAG TPA: hypothetical protein VHU92_25695 [Streptosporangiaceae bacterium]|nr:hypothetical protein [Streptosporangiaceae bacterium]
MLIWLRPRPAEQAASGWSDALAAFSVAAPLALLLESLLTLVTSDAGIADRGGFTFVLSFLAFSGLGLAVPFVLLGLRRTGGLICGAAALLLAFVAGHAIYSALFTAAVGSSFIAIPVFSYATEAGALLSSPGPRRGGRVPGWPGWLLIMVAAVAAGVLEGAVIRVHALDFFPVPAAGQLEPKVALSTFRRTISDNSKKRSHSPGAGGTTRQRRCVAAPGLAPGLAPPRLVCRGGGSPAGPG